MRCCPQGGHQPHSPPVLPLVCHAGDLGMSQRKVGVTVGLWGPEACSALPGGIATKPSPDLSSAQKLKTTTTKKRKHHFLLTYLQVLTHLQGGVPMCPTA